MPQRHLPLFPQGVTHITPELAFMKENGRVTYFNGHMPVFIHAEDDRPTFRMITSQFCVNGNAKQADIVRAFGVGQRDGRPALLRGESSRRSGALAGPGTGDIPRLEQDVPQQHSPEELAADPLLHRFTVVFDREGYSPAAARTRVGRRAAPDNST